jgi:hypothetical protein
MSAAPGYDLLLRLGVLKEGTSTYDAMLALSEHQSLTVSLDKLPSQDEAAALAGLFGAANQKLVSLSIRQDGDQSPCLRISASSLVGFTSLRDGPRRVFLRVRPKVATRRLLELATMAGMLPRWRPAGVDLAAQDGSGLVEWTLRA